MSQCLHKLITMQSTLLIVCTVIKVCMLSFVASANSHIRFRLFLLVSIRKQVFSVRNADERKCRPINVSTET